MFWMIVAILVFVWLLGLVSNGTMGEVPSPLAGGRPYRGAGQDHSGTTTGVKSG